MLFLLNLLFALLLGWLALWVAGEAGAPRPVAVVLGVLVGVVVFLCNFAARVV